MQQMRQTQHERLREAIVEHVSKVTPGMRSVLSHEIPGESGVAFVRRMLVSLIFVAIILLFFGALLFGALATDACSYSSRRPMEGRKRTPAPTMRSSQPKPSKARTSN